MGKSQSHQPRIPSSQTPAGLPSLEVLSEAPGLCAVTATASVHVPGGGQVTTHPGALHQTDEGQCSLKASSRSPLPSFPNQLEDSFLPHRECISEEGALKGNRNGSQEEHHGLLFSLNMSPSAVVSSRMSAMTPCCSIRRLIDM